MSIDSVYTLPLIAGFCVVASLLLPWCGAWLAKVHYNFKYNRLAFVGGWALVTIGAFATAVPFVTGIVGQGDEFVWWLCPYGVAVLVSWGWLIKDYTQIWP